jgi:hypothetical protein
MAYFQPSAGHLLSSAYRRLLVPLLHLLRPGIADHRLSHP